MKKSIPFLLLIVLSFSFVFSTCVLGDGAKNDPINAATNRLEAPAPVELQKTAHPFSDWNSNEIVEEMGPGWNLGNSLDGPSEGAWTSRATQSLFTAVHDLGFGNVRIPVTWSNHIKKIDGVWVIDEDWLNRVQDIVDYAMNVGLYVVINTHHDSAGEFNIVRDTNDTNGNGDRTEIIDLVATGSWLGKAIFGKTLNDGDFTAVSGTPTREHNRLATTSSAIVRPATLTTLPSRAANDEAWENGKQIMGDIWTQIANRFKDYDEHLIFESMNEPAIAWFDLHGHRTHIAINELNQIFTDSIRAAGVNNANRWLIVSGAFTGLINNGTLIGMDTEADSGHWEESFKFPTDNICSSCNIHVGGVAVCFKCGRATVPPTDVQGRFMLSYHHYPSLYFRNFYTSRQDVMIPVRHIFERVNRLFSSRKIPVYLGEYGAHNGAAFESSNATSRALLNEMICMLSRLTGIVPVIWDNQQGASGDDPYGLINRVAADISQPYMPDAQPSIEGIMRGWYGYPVDKEKLADTVTAINNESGTTRDKRNLVKDYFQQLAERADGGRYVQSEVNRIVNIKVPSKINISSGQSYEVNARCDYNMVSLNHAAYDHLIWTSSNYAIASVYNGLIKAKAPGRVRIAAYSNRSTRGGVRFMKVISVTVFPDTTISVEGSEIILGGAYDIDANHNPVINIHRNGNNGSSTNHYSLKASLIGQPGDRLFYISSIPSRVAVNSHGRIVPVYNSPESVPTVAYITIFSVSGLSKVVCVNILPYSGEVLKQPDDMALTALTSSIELDKENSEGIAEIRTNHPTSMERVVFVSNNPRVAIVNTAGIVWDFACASAVIMAVGPGSTIITAYSHSGAIVNITVTVSNFTVTTNVSRYDVKISNAVQVNNVRIDDELPMADYPADTSVKHLTFNIRQGYRAVVRVNGRVIEPTSLGYPFIIERETEIDILIRNEDLTYYKMKVYAPPMLTNIRIDGILPDTEYLAGAYNLSFDAISGYIVTVKINGIVNILRNNMYPIEVSGDTVIHITVETDIGQAFHTFAISNSIIVSNIRINDQRPEMVYQTGLYELKFDIAKGFAPVVTVNGVTVLPNKDGDYIINISANTVVQLDAILQTEPNSAYFTGLIVGMSAIVSIGFIYFALRRRRKKI